MVCYAFDTCPRCEVFACDLLRMLLSHDMCTWIKMAAIGPPSIRIKVRDTKWCSACFQWEEGLILTGAKDIRSDLSCVMVDGVPQPALLAFASHKAPHLIPLGGLTLPNDALKLRRIKALQ